mmetsp:Transcript_42001/g.116956  ORF Transcript_42001/g.116956 Transcript_42001/m.116956 type:complete len:157 (-) Transcript_42001:42-512(-)
MSGQPLDGQLPSWAGGHRDDCATGRVVPGPSSEEGPALWQATASGGLAVPPIAWRWRLSGVREPELEAGSAPGTGSGPGVAAARPRGRKYNLELLRSAEQRASARFFSEFEDTPPVQPCCSADAVEVSEKDGIPVPKKVFLCFKATSSSRATLHEL